MELHTSFSLPLCIFENSLNKNLSIWNQKTAPLLLSLYIPQVFLDALTIHAPMCTSIFPPNFSHSSHLF